MTDISKLPDSETNQIDYDEVFKRDLGIHKLAGLPEKEGWTRKGVITNYPGQFSPELARNYENHRKVGYQVVLSTEKVQDDRAFSANTNARPNTVPAPIIGKTSEGWTYVIMEIENSKLQQLKEKQAKDDYERYLASVRGTIQKTKDGVKITDEETKFK